MGDQLSAGFVITGDTSDAAANATALRNILADVNAELVKMDALTRRGVFSGGTAGTTLPTTGVPGLVPTGGGTVASAVPASEYAISARRTDLGTGQIRTNIGVTRDTEVGGVPTRFSSASSEVSGVDRNKELSVRLAEKLAAKDYAGALGELAAAKSRVGITSNELLSLEQKEITVKQQLVNYTERQADAYLKNAQAGQSRATQAAQVALEMTGANTPDRQLALDTQARRLEPQVAAQRNADALSTAKAAAATGEYSTALATLNAEAARSDLTLKQRAATLSAVTTTEGAAARAVEERIKSGMAGMTRPQRVDYLSSQQDVLSRISRTGKPEEMFPGLEVTPQMATKVRQWSDVQIREIKRVEGAHGDMASVTSRQLERILSGVLIWTAFRAVTTTLGEVVTAQSEYSLSTARFAIITNQSIDSAVGAYNRLKNAAIEQGIKPAEASTAILQSARFTSVPAEQEQLVDTASKLSKVLPGLEVGRALDIVIASLRQQGLSASEAARQGDYLVSVWRQLPGTVDQVSNALGEAAPLSDKLGVSFEKTLSIIALGASTTGESAESVTNALVRITNSLQGLEGDKFVEVTERFREFGVEAESAPGKLKPVLDIIQDVAKIFPTLSGTRQLDLLKLLFGGEKIRPEYEQITRGMLQAFASGISGGMEFVNGALDNASKVMDDQLGQIVKVVEARRLQLQQEGVGLAGVLANIAANLLNEPAKWGGKQTQQGFGELLGFWSGSSAQKGVDMRGEFMKSLLPLSPQDAAIEVDKWNAQVESLYQKNTHPDLFNPNQTFGQNIADVITAPGTAAAAKQARDALLITEEQRKIMLQELAAAKAAGLDKQPAPVSDRVTGTTGATPAPTITPLARRTPEENISSRLTAPESTYTLPTEAVDLTKYSMTEVANLLQIAREEYDQLIQKQIEYMTLIGMTPEQIDAVIKRIEEETDRTITLIRTREGLDYVTGPEARMLPRAQEKAAPPDFNFRRLSDVEPSQAPQLQALITMYTQMLAKMGSPEKSVTINTLLGENNTYKQFTGSMTALQLALEDLTKVEKAQLSGTWNMPAGATALVPITSLDLQRWNKSEGGGMDLEALKALLGATNQSGDKVAGAMGTAADRITAAIREQYDKAGVPHTEENIANASLMAQAAIKTALGGIFGIPEMAAISGGTSFPAQPNRIESTATAGGVAPAATDPVAAANIAAKAIQTAFSAMYQGFNKTVFGAPETGVQGGNADQSKAVYNSLAMVTNNIARMTSGLGAGMLGGGAGGELPGRNLTAISEKASVAVPTVNVQVSMLPIKATFNANLMVMLNGAVVARVLMPIMYQMLARALVGQGVGQKGAIR